MVTTLDALPEASRRVASRAVSGVTFLKNVREVGREYRRRGGTEKHGLTTGFVDPDGRGRVEVVVDGDCTHRFGTEVAEDVYAHEVGHAIDHAMGDLSRSAEWEAVHKREILKVRPGGRWLSRHAVENDPTESFAEVYRHIRRHGADHLGENFPLSHAFLARHGLL